MPSPIVRMLECGVILSLIPLLVLLEPRIKERRRHLFAVSLGVELVGVALLVFALLWFLFSPIKYMS